MIFLGVEVLQGSAAEITIKKNSIHVPKRFKNMIKLFRHEQIEKLKDGRVKKLDLEKYRNFKIRLYLEIKGLGRLYVLSQ